jgi:hypothetical protein
MSRSGARRGGRQATGGGATRAKEEAMEAAMLRALASSSAADALMRRFVDRERGERETGETPSSSPLYTV